MDWDSIRYVLFDAVGTLLYPDPAVADVYAHYGRQFGSRRTPAEILPRFRAALQRPTTQERLSEQGERERWQHIIRVVFDDLPGADNALFEGLWQHFAEARHWRLFDDVAQAWHALQQSGRHLGIASNFDERLTTIVAAHPPLDRCETLFISSQIGYAKPDRRFYQAVEERLAALPHEILLVGDDRRCDYDGARAANWNAVLIDRDAASSAGAIITSLHEWVDQLSTG